MHGYTGERIDMHSERYRASLRVLARPHQNTLKNTPRSLSDGLNPRPWPATHGHPRSCVTRQSTNRETVRQSNYCETWGEPCRDHGNACTIAASRFTKPGTFAKGRQRTRFMNAKSPHNGRGPPPHARLRNFFLTKNPQGSPCFDPCFTSGWCGRLDLLEKSHDKCEFSGGSPVGGGCGPSWGCGTLESHRNRAV